MCEQGRIDDVVFEQGLNCGGYNVVCPPCGGFEVGSVCAVVVYGGMSPPPSSIHSDKELCKKITSDLWPLVKLLSVISVRVFVSLQNVFEDRALYN